MVHKIKTLQKQRNLLEMFVSSLKNNLNNNKPLDINDENYFDKIIEIHGFLSKLDYFIIDFLLNYQKNINGNYLEIGSLHGKTLALILKHCLNNEKVFSVDPGDYENIIRSNLKFLNIDKLTYIKNTSDNILNYDIKDIKFCHIDGCHSFEVCYQDLCNTMKYMNDNGIIVLDDFVINEYNGIVAAFFKALYTNKISFVPLLTSDRKLYLCSKSIYDDLYNNIKSNIYNYFNLTFYKTKIPQLNIAIQKFDIYEMLSISTYRNYIDEPGYIKKLN